jgi:hypothetical protein
LPVAVPTTPLPTMKILATAFSSCSGPAAGRAAETQG